MGIEFKIDAEAGVVFTKGLGNISFEEFKDYRNKLTSHPDYNKKFLHLADYREVTMARTTTQALDIARSRLFAKVAMVAGEQSFGQARMIQGWAGGEEGGFMVFRDMASAREWLGLPSEDDS